MRCEVVLLGAECTGKSSLAQALAQALAAQQPCVVPEHLRAWCERAGRTPRAEEQAAIAAAQTAAIAAASGLVIADTSALMTAVYSLHYFQDERLLASALAAQRKAQLTLVCSPQGLPWQADGLQRDGPAVQQRCHALLLDLLQRHALPFHLLQGSLPQRTATATALIRTHCLSDCP